MPIGSGVSIPTPPAPTYGSAPTQNLWPTIFNTTMQQNANNPNSPPLDPYYVYAIAAGEGVPNGSGGWVTSSAGAVGPMQVLPGTANQVGIPAGGDPTSPNFQTANIQAGVAYLGSLNQAFNGNPSLVASGYFAGPGGNFSSPQVQTYANNVLARYGSGGLSSQSNAQGTGSSTIVQGASSGLGSPTGSAYSPLVNNSANVDLSQLVAPIVITEGLDAVPWYTDNGLLTGNARLRREVQPVVFKVLLHDNKDFFLSSGGNAGVPIQVQLNASMKSMSWSMKHLYHHQRTRTAHHITMWGMQADTIEGQCTTGVFMNQFGLTDYYSTRTVNDKLKTLVTSGEMFTNGNSANPVTIGGLGTSTPINLSAFNNAATPLTVNGPGGQSITTVPGGGGNTNGFINSGDAGFQKIMQNQAKNNPNFIQTDAFRVAAQDAFMEFLALFKMNGSVWFWNKLYQDAAGEQRDWTGIQAWSPTLGMSGAQKNGRNNDVLTRGGVVMTYRNFAYQGYFKSLQWTMDARNPYKWDFSFVFQVEKTVGQQFIPGN